MLEASDLAAMDSVSPFVGAVVDSTRGLSVTEDVTKVFTEYVDTVNFIPRRHMPFKWNEESIRHLEALICYFEKKTREEFDRY